MEHFSSLLNYPSDIPEEAMNALPQHPLEEGPAPAPTSYKTTVKQMSTEKSPGLDAIPAELYKQAGYHIARHLTRLFQIIWEQESVSQDFEDVNIVHLYQFALSPLR